MPENEFEKRVKQELDSLRLKPSAGVWEQVEAGIQPEKRRRRWVLWLPIVFLAMGAGGYLVWKDHAASKTETIQHSGVIVAKTNDEGKTKIEDANKNQAVSQSKSESNLDQQASNGDIAKKENDPTRQNKSSIGNNEDHSNRNALTTDKQAITAPIRKHRSPGPTKVTGQKATGTITSKNSQRKNSAGEMSLAAVGTPALQNDAAAQPDASALSENPVDSSVLKPLVATVLEKPDSSVSVAKKDIKIPPTKYAKWELGVTARAGISGERNEFFLLDKNARLDFNSGSTSAPGPYPGGGYAIDSIYKKSAISWGVGIYLQRNLSKQWALKSGINYSEYSFETKVGARIDSPVYISNYVSNTVSYIAYQSGKTTEYKNRFHVLEIPLAVEWRPKKDKKVPIHAEAGVAAGFIFESNLIYPDRAQNIYYQDHAILNKMQWSVHAGVSVGVFANSKHPLYIGPQFQYMFSNLINSASESKQHLGFIGIRASWKLWESTPMQRSGKN